MSNQLWVERTHEEYEMRSGMYTYVQDHYTGAAKEKAEAQARNLNDRIIRDKKTQEIKDVQRARGDIYLWRRAQGETTDAYTERVVLSKFPNVHANVVDSFAGSISSIEHKADRDISVFGDVEETETFAGRIWNNADGSGRDYLAMYSDAASRFTNHLRIWYLVEEESFVWLDSRDVVNWIEENGVLTDVLVKERVDGRESIKDEYPDDEDRLRYMHYHREGFDRYRIVKGDNGQRELELLEDESAPWDYPHYSETNEDLVTVPIGFVELPVDRQPGYKMAQDANYLYNLLSDVRNLLRNANHPKLAGDVEDEEFEFTEAALIRGSNMLQGAWDYISPNIENAQGAYMIYEKERQNFYITNHQRYNDAGKEATATEVRQDDQRGQQSWLNVLTTGLDELENRVLFLLAQKQFPEDRTKWREFTIQRSRDFKPVDVEGRVEKLRNVFLGGESVDVGEAGRMNVAKEIATLMGVKYEEAELEQALSDEEIARRQEEEFNREREELDALINRAS